MCLSPVSRESSLTKGPKSAGCTCKSSYCEASVMSPFKVVLELFGSSCSIHALFAFISFFLQMSQFHVPIRSLLTVISAWAERTSNVFDTVRVVSPIQVLVQPSSARSAVLTPRKGAGKGEPYMQIRTVALEMFIKRTLHVCRKVTSTKRARKSARLVMHASHVVSVARLTVGLEVAKLALIHFFFDVSLNVCMQFGSGEEPCGTQRTLEDFCFLGRVPSLHMGG